MGHIGRTLSSGRQGASVQVTVSTMNGDAFWEPRQNNSPHPQGHGEDHKAASDSSQWTKSGNKGPKCPQWMHR